MHDSSDVSRRMALRDYLAEHNGIRGLEILEPMEIDRAARIFHRDGFVVVRNILTAEQTEFLRAGVDEVVADILTLDPDRAGNRGSHRYSFGESSTTRAMLHRPEWQMLIDLPTLTPILAALFGSSDYMVRSGGGDFCLPGAHGYQPLHSDMRDREDTGTPYSSFTDRRGHLTTATCRVRTSASTSCPPTTLASTGRRVRFPAPSIPVSRSPPSTRNRSG